MYLQTHEKVIRIISEGYTSTYIFPNKSNDALGRIQSAIIGNSIAFVEAYASADRTSAKTLVNARRISEVEVLNVEVPAAITAKYDLAKAGDEAAIKEIEDYFSL